MSLAGCCPGERERPEADWQKQLAAGSSPVHWLLGPVSLGIGSCSRSSTAPVRRRFCVRRGGALPEQPFPQAQLPERNSSELLRNAAAGVPPHEPHQMHHPSPNQLPPVCILIRVPVMEPRGRGKGYGASPLKKAAAQPLTPFSCPVSLS